MNRINTKISKELKKVKIITNAKDSRDFALFHQEKGRQQATKELLDKHNGFVEKLKGEFNYYFKLKEGYDADCTIEGIIDKLSKEFKQKEGGGE